MLINCTIRQGSDSLVRSYTAQTSKGSVSLYYENTTSGLPTICIVDYNSNDPNVIGFNSSHTVSVPQGTNDTVHPQWKLIGVIVESYTDGLFLRLSAGRPSMPDAYSMIYVPVLASYTGYDVSVPIQVTYSSGATKLIYINISAQSSNGYNIYSISGVSSSPAFPVSSPSGVGTRLQAWVDKTTIIPDIHTASDPEAIADIIVNSQTFQADVQSLVAENSEEFLAEMSRRYVAT